MQAARRSSSKNRGASRFAIEHRSAALLGLLLASAPAAAPAATTQSLPPLSQTSAAATAGYCRFIDSVSASESAVLLSPQLYVNFGLTNAAGAALTTDENSTWSTALRLTAGLRYSGQRLYQGILNRSRADAECQRYRALSDLSAFVLEGREGSKPALLAKAAVLDEALPRALQILEQVRGLLKEQRAAADEVNATAIRVDALRAEAAQARQEAEGLPEPSPARRPIEALLQVRRDSEDRVEVLEGRLRRAQAWDLSVNAGYDRVFLSGTGTSVSAQVPVLALLSLTLNPGGLWQPRADARARAARRDFSAQDLEGAEQRAERMVSKLRAVQRAERVRLQETAVLSADLAARMKAVDGIGNNVAQVRQYRDYLWFDWVRMRAEHAYLSAHLADTARALGEAEESR